LWLVALTGIFSGYASGKFGGREYWEFDPVWAMPLAGAWMALLIHYLRAARGQKQWPVYAWMWGTGTVFFLFSFAENYLWLFPYFREHVVTDTAIQWKVNGSLVGAWNQLVYATAFCLMDRIQPEARVGRSRLAFTMYFLGLFNLMFNWGHHIYTLPTASYVRYLGYLVSMTEWVFFIKIIYNWRSSVTDAQKHAHFFPYRFLLASDVWVFLSLGQALVMSVPAWNLYTHGTHVTVAHAMGTTIGINSMILLAACFAFPEKVRRRFAPGNRLLSGLFWTVQLALLVFWLALNGAGIQKGLWQMGDQAGYFSKMMEGLKPWFAVFYGAGIVLAAGLLGLAGVLLNALVRQSRTTRKVKIILKRGGQTYRKPEVV
jgi:nitric oxide reductase subunit B